MTTGDTTPAGTAIAREIVVDAPIDTVWRIITEPDRITQWFAERVELDLRPGGDGKLVFHDKTGEEVTAGIVVQVVDPPHHFSFRWGHVAGVMAGADNSLLVEFNLVAEAPERTRVQVAETGLDHLDWSVEQKVAYADDHREGWETHLDRLHDHFAGSPGAAGR